MVEIRSLRQRLEESICTNDRLREQLERRLASTGKASGAGLQRGQLGGGWQALHAPIARGKALGPCVARCCGEGLSTRPPLQVCPAMCSPRGRSWGCS